MATPDQVNRIREAGWTWAHPGFALSPEHDGVNLGVWGEGWAVHHGDVQDGLGYAGEYLPAFDELTMHDLTTLDRMLEAAVTISRAMAPFLDGARGADLANRPGHIGPYDLGGIAGLIWPSDEPYDDLVLAGQPDHVCGPDLIALIAFDLLVVEHHLRPRSVQP